MKIVVVNKGGTDESLSDALTKGVDAVAIQKHLEGAAIEIRHNRHAIAPEPDSKAQGPENRFEDKLILSGHEDGRTTAYNL